MTKGKRWTAAVGRLVKQLLSAVGELGRHADSDIEDGKRTKEETKVSARAPHSEASAPADSLQEHPAEEDGTPRVASDTDASATQYVVPRPAAETVYLVIGLDFGTSCTKVVIQNPFGRLAATAIPWDLGNGGPQYLLPTALYENSAGEFALHPDGEPVRCRHDLKVNLMDHLDNEDARGRTAAYLGLLLRKAREWLLEDQRDVYGNSRENRVGAEHRDPVCRVRRRRNDVRRVPVGRTCSLAFVPSDNPNRQPSPLRESSGVPVVLMRRLRYAERESKTHWYPLMSFPKLLLRRLLGTPDLDDGTTGYGRAAVGM